MTYKELKESYPQKYCLKVICKTLYYIGCGDFWYEKEERSRFERIVYPIWATISNLYVYLFVLNELITHTRSDLTEKERSDLFQHSCAHSTICGKISVLYLQRNRIKVFFKTFLEDARPLFSSAEVDKAAMKKGIFWCVSVVVVTYGALVSALLDGIRIHFKEDIPIRGEVTFYPRPYHTGLLVDLVRVVVEFHWYFIVAYMLLVDCLSVMSLVFLEFKFVLLQVYFRNLKNIYLKDTEGKTQRQLDNEFKDAFIVGIKLHEHSLWCATNVQYALGNVYSVQIVQSMGLFVMCLIKLVVNDLTLMFLVANAIYVSCLLVLTGAYMLVAGDVTYQASVLSTAIFHSGWEMSHSRCELRPLILQAIQRSHVPIYMTAFGIFQLSYGNFISVLRSSYSFFAVMR